MTPRLPVAVVIPAYNRAGTLERCLGSVFSQRPALPAEVIVVDDGSADDSAALAESLGATVIRHAENRGLAAARNTGLTSTECEFVAFLDSDDEWLPNHLATLWEIRDGHALIGSAALHRSESAFRYHGTVTRRPLVLRSPDQLIANYNMFNVSACMVKRDVAVELGGFQPVWGVEDVDLWVRVLERHTAVSSPIVSAVYHIHAEQMSSATDRMMAGHRAVAEAHIGRTGESRAVLDRWEACNAWNRGRAALAERRIGPAIHELRRALGSPQGAIGVSQLLWSRFRSRRRSSEIDFDGRPTVAVIVRDEPLRRRVLERLSGRPVRDLSSRPASALLSLLTRPAGLTVVGSRRGAAVLRRLGIAAVASDEPLEL